MKGESEGGKDECWEGGWDEGRTKRVRESEKRSEREG